MGHTAVSTTKDSSVTLKIWQQGAKEKQIGNDEEWRNQKKNPTAKTEVGKIN